MLIYYIMALEQDFDGDRYFLLLRHRARDIYEEFMGLVVEDSGELDEGRTYVEMIHFLSEMYDEFVSIIRIEREHPNRARDEFLEEADYRTGLEYLIELLEQYDNMGSRQNWEPENTLIWRLNAYLPQRDANASADDAVVHAHLLFHDPPSQQSGPEYADDSADEVANADAEDPETVIAGEMNIAPTTDTFADDESERLSRELDEAREVLSDHSEGMNNFKYLLTNLDKKSDKDTKTADFLLRLLREDKEGFAKLDDFVNKNLRFVEYMEFPYEEIERFQKMNALFDVASKKYERERRDRLSEIQMGGNRWKIEKLLSK